MSIVPAKDKEGHGCLLLSLFEVTLNLPMLDTVLCQLFQNFGYLEPVSILSTASACSGNVFNKGGEINLDMKACMECSMTRRVSTRHAGTLSWPVIWCPLKLIFFQFFWPRTVLERRFEGASPLHSTADSQS